MLFKRLLPLGAIGLLAGVALAGCGGNAVAAAKVTPTPTCPATPQITETTGTVTAVNSTQMTVETTKGETLVTLSTRTRYSSQQKTPASDIQDGTRVQVVVEANSDGTYSAVQVAIRQATGTGTGGGFPGGGNGGTPVPGRTPFPSRTPGTRGTATPGAGIPARCRTTAGRGGAGGAGGAGGTGTVEGGLPSGAKVLDGTVATINGQYMTITATDKTNYNVELTSTTVISKITAAQASDVKVNSIVLASGTKASNGSVSAQSVTILLSLPTGQ